VVAEVRQADGQVAAIARQHYFNLVAAALAKAPR
jgi:hypothetical protein